MLAPILLFYMIDRLRPTCQVITPTFIQASHFSIFFFSVFAAFSKESKYELDKQVMDYVQQFQFLYKEKRDVYQKEVHY